MGTVRGTVPGRFSKLYVADVIGSGTTEHNPQPHVPTFTLWIDRPEALRTQGNTT